MRCVMALALFVSVLAAQEPKWKSTTPINDRPNPYRRDANWAQLPVGLKWGAVIGAEHGPNGDIYVVHRCFENSCAGRSEPPIFRFTSVRHGPQELGQRRLHLPARVPRRRAGERVGDRRARQGRQGAAGLQVQRGRRAADDDWHGWCRGRPRQKRLTQPTDVVTAPNGDVFITEGHDIGGEINRVSKWSKDGTFIKAWGRTGAARGEFNVPHTIALDSRGRLFVGDRHNNRIQIFDQNGTFLDEWTQFGRPSGIAITNDDTIYVADSESWGPDEPGWKKGIRIGSAKDGSVKYFIEDIESTTDEHSGAEGVGVDRDGQCLRRGRPAHDARETHAEEVGARGSGLAVRSGVGGQGLADS